MSKALIRIRAVENEPNSFRDRYLKLSPRLRQIADLIPKGMSNRQIAKELGVKEQAIKNYMVAVFSYLGAESRLQLAVLMTHMRMGQD